MGLSVDEVDIVYFSSVSFNCHYIIKKLFRSDVR